MFHPRSQLLGPGSSPGRVLLVLTPNPYHSENLGDSISGPLDNSTLNPSWFWSKVKNIIKKNPRSEFRVTDTGTGQGNRLESFEDIENSFRTEWREHFSAPSPADIDPIALQVVNEFHDQNPDICKPHSHINLRRLDYSNDPLCNSTIKPFHPRDVMQVIFDFENRAPGPDTIKRIHLFNAPNIFSVAITNIFNCALSAGL